jgi:hypothetical protein
VISVPEVSEREGIAYPIPDWLDALVHQRNGSFPQVSSLLIDSKMENLCECHFFFFFSLSLSPPRLQLLLFAIF